MGRGGLIDLVQNCDEVFVEDESPKGERTGVSEWSQREAVRHRRSKAEVADRELGSSSQSIIGADGNRAT